jgi:hypothetical protein
MRHLTILLFALAVLAGGVAQADESGKPGRIKNNPIIIKGGESRLMSVVFSHKSHRDKGFNCKNCHHESSADIPYSSCREECHAVPGARERDSMSMFMSFHARGTDRSCYGCHSRLAAESPDSYPAFKGCQPCHSTSARLALEALSGK